MHQAMYEKSPQCPSSPPFQFRRPVLDVHVMMVVVVSASLVAAKTKVGADSHFPLPASGLGLASVADTLAALHWSQALHCLQCQAAQTRSQPASELRKGLAVQFVEAPEGCRVLALVRVYQLQAGRLGEYLVLEQPVSAWVPAGH